MVSMGASSALGAGQAEWRSFLTERYSSLVLSRFSLGVGLPLCSSTPSARELINGTYLSPRSHFLSESRQLKGDGGVSG